MSIESSFIQLAPDSTMDSLRWQCQAFSPVLLKMDASPAQIHRQFDEIQVEWRRSMVEYCIWKLFLFTKC